MFFRKMTKWLGRLSLEQKVAFLDLAVNIAMLVLAVLSLWLAIYG